MGTYDKWNSINVRLVTKERIDKKKEKHTIIRKENMWAKWRAPKDGGEEIELVDDRYV